MPAEAFLDRRSVVGDALEHRGIGLEATYLLEQLIGSIDIVTVSSIPPALAQASDAWRSKPLRELGQGS